MREGIPRVEEEVYYNSYLCSPGQGTRVHNVL